MVIFSKSPQEALMSKHLDIALDMAQALKRVGVLDEVTMRDIETLCLVPTPQFGAEEIKRLRSKTRMSQAVFAALLNVGVSTVQQWEMGRKKPSGPSLKLLDLLDRKGVEGLL